VAFALLPLSGCGNRVIVEFMWKYRVAYLSFPLFNTTSFQRVELARKQRKIHVVLQNISLEMHDDIAPLSNLLI